MRGRREDIPLLVAHFLRKYNAETGKKLNEVHPDVMRVLSNYSWPGNVRELENAIERAVVLARGNILTTENLSLGMQSLRHDQDNNSISVPYIQDAGMTEMVEAFEKELLWDAYLKARRVKAEAAKLLGIKRSTFRYKFDKYKLDEKE